MDKYAVKIAKASESVNPEQRRKAYKIVLKNKMLLPTTGILIADTITGKTIYSIIGENNCKSVGDSNQKNRLDFYVSSHSYSFDKVACFK